jgi:DNA-binding MarR family transcriptional regulator
MGGALAARMDAVLFEMKKAHLAGARFGRTLLKPFTKLTPARFDMLVALSEGPMRQNDLWRLLGVVRSVVSEMLDSMRSLGWVKRIRAADGRTRLVSLTVRGAQLFRRAYALCIGSGEMQLELDCAMKGPHGFGDSEEQRVGVMTTASKIIRYLGWVLEGASHLYWFDPEEIFDQLDWPIGDNARYELLVADEGTVSAPMFQAGDVLAEIQDAS